MAREICEKFVYKYSETIECDKNYPTFQEIFKIQGKIAQEFLGLDMRIFQGIVFVWTQTYWEIFKPELVYL